MRTSVYLKFVVTARVCPQNHYMTTSCRIRLYTCGTRPPESSIGRTTMRLCCLQLSVHVQPLRRDVVLGRISRMSLKSLQAL